MDRLVILISISLLLNILKPHWHSYFCKRNSSKPPKQARFKVNRYLQSIDGICVIIITLLYTYCLAHYVEYPHSSKHAEVISTIIVSVIYAIAVTPFLITIYREGAFIEISDTYIEFNLSVGGSDKNTFIRFEDIQEIVKSDRGYYLMSKNGSTKRIRFKTLRLLNGYSYIIEFLESFEPSRK